VIKAVAVLAVAALIAAPIIYAAYSADVLNVSLRITGIDGGVLLDIEAAYRGSVPGSPVYGYISVDAATTYVGSRYSGNFVLSGEINQGVAGVRCEEAGFSYRLQAYGRGLNGAITVAYLYSCPGVAFSLQLEAESIEVSRGVARLNISALLQSRRPLRELLPPDVLNALALLSPQTVNAMLLASGVNWLFIDELSIELVGDSALKGYASLIVDYVQMLRSLNLPNQLIDRIVEGTTAVSYNYTYEFSLTLHSNCSILMAGRGYFDYDNLAEEFVKTQQTLRADMLLNALLSDEGKETLGFLRELVPMPSNSTLSFRFFMSGGSISVRLNAKSIRLIHRDLSGAEGSRRVAQIVLSLVESLRTFVPIPTNISVASDVPVTTDPAIASGISRAAGLAASGRLFSQPFSAMISAIALPITYVSAVTPVTVVTTVTVPQTPVASTPVVPTPQMPTATTTQTVTVTRTVTETATYTVTAPTTVTVTQMLVQTATTILTTTVARISIESIAAGAVIAIIGLAAGLLMRKK